MSQSPNNGAKRSPIYMPRSMHWWKVSTRNVSLIPIHFLSADFQSGGHLLECRPNGIRAGVQFINSVELGLPMSLDYLTLDFQRNIDEDLDQAEK
jgi:Alpha-acetolactate decarboxylase